MGTWSDLFAKKYMSVRFLARSGKKLNLDTKSDQIPPFSKGVRGILGSRSVVNIAKCRITDTH
jgi:hypothetical protein